MCTVVLCVYRGGLCGIRCCIYLVVARCPREVAAPVDEDIVVVKADVAGGRRPYRVLGVRVVGQLDGVDVRYDHVAVVAGLL